MGIEEANYWSDPRVLAGMISRPKTEETGRGPPVILWETEDDEGTEQVFRLPCVWEVCPTCDGNGRHVNPSIDAGGLSAEDFDQDPDFYEGYMGGVYDVTCAECGGKRVVPVPDVQACDKAILKRYISHLEDEAAHARDVAAERRMGC